jgi:hypothetical protein
MTKVQVMLPDGKWYLAEDLEAVQMSLGEHHFSELWIRFLDPTQEHKSKLPCPALSLSERQVTKK